MSFRLTLLEARPVLPATVIVLDDASPRTLDIDGRNNMIWPRVSWRALLVVGLASRILVMSLGMLAPLSPPGRPLVGLKDPSIQAEMATPLRRSLTPWYRWDALWYLDVARKNYQYFPDRESNAAFLPLLPAIMAAGSAVGLDIFWVGMIVPNLAFALGLIAFGLTAKKITGDDGVAWRACLLLIAFPTSFFFSAPYPESLGFVLSAWGIWAWIEGRPLTAAASLSLSTAARLACVAPSVAIGAEWLDDVLHRRKPRPWALPVASAAAVGIVSFCLYLGFHLGDSMAHFKAHKAWGRKPGLQGISAFASQLYETATESRMFIVLTLAMLVFFGHRWILGRLPAIRPSHWGGWAKFALPILLATAALVVYVAFSSRSGPLPSRVFQGTETRDNLSFLFFLGLGLSAWHRRGPFWGCLTLVPIALAATSGTSMSLGRVVLMSYPGFIELSELLGKRWSFALALIGTLACQCYYLVKFARLGQFIE